MDHDSASFQVQGFPMHSALVTTEWLQENVGASNLCVVEATASTPAPAKGADKKPRGELIPGACLLDLNAVSEPDCALPNMLPQAYRFSRIIGAVGIDESTFVVLYDADGMLGSARLWWMFRTFGFKRVAVLDGGLPKWLREQRPVGGPRLPEPGKEFLATLQSGGVRTLEQMKEAVRSRAQIVDARSSRRFHGLEDEPRPGLRKGHIPHSINLPYTTLLDPTAGTLMSQAELKATFQSAGLDFDLPIICSCGSGVSACVIALALYEIGKEDVSIYDGSWSEWGSQQDTAIQT